MATTPSPQKMPALVSLVCSDIRHCYPITGTDPNPVSKLAEINGTCSCIVSADLDSRWLWLRLLPDAMVEEDIVDVSSSPRSTFSNFRRCRNRLRRRSSRVRGSRSLDETFLVVRVDRLFSSVDGSVDIGSSRKYLCFRVSVTNCRSSSRLSWFEKFGWSIDGCSSKKSSS